MAGANYTRLFNTRLEHDFYVSGITKDLSVIPTSETVLSMKNSNMLFKMDDTGFRVLYRIDETGNPFIDFTDVKLVFGVQIKNINEFSNITKWASLPGYAADKMPYFSNIGNLTTPALALSFLDFLKPAKFNYEFPQTAANAGDNGSITITNSQGNIVTPSFPDPTQVKANGSKKWIYPIDFSNMPRGLYEFETSGNAQTITRTVYIDNDLVKQNVFAIIELLAKDGKPVNYNTNYPANREYKLIFERRQTQWKYIVVLKSPAVNPPPPGVPATIGIEDDSSPVQPEYGTLTFALNSSITVNGLPARVFLSNQVTIPYFEQAKYGLTIKKNPGVGAEMLMTNIAGPPLGLTSADPANFDVTEIYVTI
jgi:hypothetical protein